MLVPIRADAEDLAETYDEYGAHVAMTPERMAVGVLPAVDPATSVTRAPLTLDHRQIADAARTALTQGSPEGGALTGLLRQPFYMAKPFTAQPAGRSLNLPSLLDAARNALA